uniref:Uncharacterized protein n=1 Tax=Molossus molossus TaxID=27622 RepID=A0A7J8C939_MOLMO|nr:hypothetical protein HJG59_009979 [Molossus molossus]
MNSLRLVTMHFASLLKETVRLIQVVTAGNLLDFLPSLIISKSVTLSWMVSIFLQRLVSSSKGLEEAARLGAIVGLRSKFSEITNTEITSMRSDVEACVRETNLHEAEPISGQDRRGVVRIGEDGQSVNSML